MLAKEYAKAIYELTSNSKDFNEEFNNLINGLKDNLDYIKLMESKSLSKNQKKLLIEELKFERLKEILFVLIDNNRFKHIFEIHSEYLALVDRLNNIMRIKLYTAKSLSTAEQSLITKHFENIYKKQVVLSEVVDASLISGIKVEYNGKLLDDTSLNELMKMKQMLAKEVI